MIALLDGPARGAKVSEPSALQRLFEIQVEAIGMPGYTEVHEYELLQRPCRTAAKSAMWTRFLRFDGMERSGVGDQQAEI